MALFRKTRPQTPPPTVVRLRATWTQQRDPNLRAFLVNLHRAYESSLAHGAVVRDAEEDFWAAVAEASRYHESAVPGAKNLARIPSALLESEPYKLCLAAALDEYAAQWKVPGGLVQAYLAAQAINRRMMGLGAMWEKEAPSAYACWLVPHAAAEAGQTVGLLGAHQGRFTFDPQVGGPRQGLEFTRNDVDHGEFRGANARMVLLFDQAGAMQDWARAEIHGQYASAAAMLLGADIEIRKDDEAAAALAAWLASVPEPPDDQPPAP
jgi:hypothetical protein